MVFLHKFKVAYDLLPHLQLLQGWHHLKDGGLFVYTETAFEFDSLHTLQMERWPASYNDAERMAHIDNRLEVLKEANQLERTPKLTKAYFHSDTLQPTKVRSFQLTVLLLHYMPVCV